MLFLSSSFDVHMLSYVVRKRMYFFPFQFMMSPLIGQHQSHDHIPSLLLVKKAGIKI